MTTSILDTLKHKVQQQLGFSFAKYCALCRSYLDQSEAAHSDFCPYCVIQLQRNLLCCQSCSIPLDIAKKDDLICGACQQSPPSFDKAIATFCYSYPLNKLISAFKFNQRLDLIPSLAKEMLSDLKIIYDFSSKKPDAIIPIPLHRLHEFKRGYNQAKLLAKYLSKELKIPMHNNFLIRNKFSPKQSSLNKQERHKNLVNAFSINKKDAPCPKHVVLVDDVMTTGSTFEAASKTLRKAGVERIEVWSLARAEI